MTNSIRTFTLYMVLNVRTPGYEAAKYNAKYLQRIEERPYEQKVWQKATWFVVVYSPPAADEGHQYLRYDHQHLCSNLTEYKCEHNFLPRFVWKAILSNQYDKRKGYYPSEPE